jgi:hypothetical protein
MFRSRFEIYRGEINSLPLSRLEHRFLSYPNRSLIAIPTEPFWVIYGSYMVLEQGIYELE